LLDCVWELIGHWLALKELEEKMTASV